jgi:hypothetical protein
MNDMIFPWFKHSFLLFQVLIDLQLIKAPATLSELVVDLFVESTFLRISVLIWITRLLNQSIHVYEVHT